MHRRGRGKRRGGLKFEQPVDDGEEEDMEVDGEMVEEEEGEEIESEWEFFPLAPHDWHAVKQHCGRMLDARQWDVGSLATLVTETQRRVGSAIKMGEQSSEALGLGALLNMRTYADTPCIAAIRHFVVQHFEGQDRMRVEGILAQNTVALFVNERILNLPPLVALHLHLSIFEEVEEQHKLGPSEYDFDYLLFVTNAYRESEGDKSAQGNLKKVREKEVQLEWFRPEEEVYAKYAACSCMWPVSVQDQASRWTFDGRIAQFKVLMLVPTSAIPKIRARLEAINIGQYDE